ncbi:acyl-homoserine-lactone synthase [Sphingomonas sp.]|uniref:acyl-homoserine-lactone synthase n=1 Tax=Sphingomonas sp. TaxID=28214 RepID=UPI0025EC16E1|nr:acyl-homoserine-lactone synthase [Sphingomonas sp.]
MIRVLPFEDRARAPRTFDTMFEDRKRLFVDLLGWDVPVVDGRLELDAFDTDGALYVMALDADGRHQGSLRLLPSDRPHLLGTVFAHLCPLGVPQGSGIYEITRLCLPSRLGARCRLAVRNALISAMVDHALRAGVTRLTGLVEESFRKHVLTMGWLAEPLGPAIASDGQLLGAFQLHLDDDTPTRLGWTGIYREGEGPHFAPLPDGSGMIGLLPEEGDDGPEHSGGQGADEDAR